MRKAIASLALLLALLPLLGCKRDDTIQTSPQLAKAEGSLPGMEGLSWDMTQENIAQHLTVLPKTIAGANTYRLADADIEGCSFTRVLFFQNRRSPISGMVLHHFSSGQQFADCETRIVAGFKAKLGAHPNGDLPHQFVWRGPTIDITLDTSCAPNAKAFSCLRLEYEDRERPKIGRASC